MLLLTLLGATLRLYDLGGKALSYDEAFSLWMARHSLEEIWRLTWLIDFHPPLYYTILHAWLVWGESEGALRLLSALLGILTIPLTYALGRIIGGHRLGILSALLLALSPFHVYYAQEARMYTLLTLAAASAMWGLASLLRGHVDLAWAEQKPDQRETSWSHVGTCRKYWWRGSPTLGEARQPSSAITWLSSSS